MSFSYSEMTTRNIGFVSEAEQRRLRSSRVLVIGAGGMGGACLQSIARAGVGRLVLADLDEFEISNLNRQVFSDLESVGKSKVEVTRQKLLQINPELEITTYGREWTDRLDQLLPGCDLVINGMDSIAEGILLYRKARQHGVAIIDAYTASLPSVTLVRPGDPTPEERLGYPTQGLSKEQWSDQMIDECKLREIEYVLTHSSSASAIDMAIAFEMISGARKRISFAPMVITTGNLMAFAAISHLLNKKMDVDFRGYFFNPYTARVERPLPSVIAAPKAWLVRRFLRKAPDGSAIRAH